MDGYNLELDGEVYTTTETAFATMLEPGTHTWRVSAYNIWGNSVYSDAWVFEVMGPPGIPLLVSPADGDSVPSPVIFEWIPSLDGYQPDGYLLTLDSTLVITLTEAVTSTTLIVDPCAHTWGVAVFNVSGVSDFTTEWMFEVPYQVFLPFTSKA